MLFPIRSVGKLRQYQWAEGQEGLSLSQGKHLSSLEQQVYLRFATAASCLWLRMRNVPLQPDSTCTVRGESCRPLHSTNAVPRGHGFGRVIPRPLWCLSLCPLSMDHVCPHAACWCIFCGQARTCSHWAGAEGQVVLHCSYLQIQQES